ncbi:hypothetical protein CGLO_13290 [Colletotrichum gloeosporioides Cg-14]|uniref:Uncharacterized protein n=1 Tax=Colletotrichum gloeosporioides (strain Cg-14) TaxID=1237896 RepID=T0JWV0_COLGC|nr:hypothetical protein CGLO_13290 [Colletotrichum gloeosporioides Cg-14]
MYTFQFVG